MSLGVPILRVKAGLGGSVGCAVRLETRRSRVQPTPRLATFFRGDMKHFLRSFFPFHLFKKGSCHSFLEIDHETFSMVILSLPLIQEGQLSVSGERMCTILVNHLED